MIKLCKTCGKEFIVYPSQLRIGRGKFCSWNCTVKTITKNLNPMAFKGGKHTEEWKRKMSERTKGNKYRLGTKQTDEWIKKISKINKGNKYRLGQKASEETKEKMRKSMTGQTRSHKGKPWSGARIKSQQPKKPVKISDKEYDPNWKEIRQKIYVRDKGKCRECGVKTVCLGNDVKKVIQCHHIDYNITNNDPKNLITLCASCHMKTNFKRENWIKYYKLKMKEGIQI